MWGGETPRDVMEIGAIYSEIDLTFLDLPSLDHLAELPKISDSAIFFEALAEETKKAGIIISKAPYHKYFPVPFHIP